MQQNADPRNVLHARRIVGVTAAAAAVFTLVVTLSPAVGFAYQSLEAHVAIETAATIVGGLAAYLFAGRARRTGDLTDVALAGALALLALTNLGFSLVPALVAGPPGRFSTWAPVAGRLLAGAGLVYAAWAPGRTLAQPQAALRGTMAAVAAITAVIAAGVAVLGSDLPRGVDPQLSPEEAGGPVLDAAPAIVVIQGVAMLLYAAAAIGFLRQVERRPEQFRAWLAAALVLGAFARLNYLLFPSLYSEYVYSGDVLRLGLYLLLLWGAGREIASYQRRLAESAVFQERRRLARELHDGLAAELAYIAAHGRRAQSAGGGAAMAPILSAAERALDEARGALAALTRPIDEPLERSLAREAERLTERAGVGLRLDLDPSLTVSDELREALLRILREAVNNAVRHGDPQQVTVRLGRDGGLRLAVVDDGRGFDAAADTRADAFGLVSMRERAQALGGTLEIRSDPGGGTEVLARFP